MVTPETMETVIFEVPNSLRVGKLETQVANIVTAVQDNKIAQIQNLGEYTECTVAVVEAAKRVLSRTNEVYQSSLLKHEPVYTPPKEEEPLVKPKIRHYRLHFEVRLSLTKLPFVAGSSVQTMLDLLTTTSNKE